MDFLYFREYLKITIIQISRDSGSHPYYYFTWPELFIHCTDGGLSCVYAFRYKKLHLLVLSSLKTARTFFISIRTPPISILLFEISFSGFVTHDPVS